MFKRLITGLVAAAAVAAPAATASADPPIERVQDDFIVLFPDTNVDKSVFINITARDFCDWLASGPSGPPPAIEPVTQRGVVTNQGAVIGKFTAELYIEMWEFDDDVPPLVGPCEDIEQQLAAGGDPFATGTATYSLKDNDAFGSGTRGSAFGERVTADLVGADGTEYEYRNVFRINDRCRADGSGPPSCLVDTSQLRAK